MSVPTPSPLFTPLKVGAFSLAHRVVMPALRRHRADAPDGVPNLLMTQHYAQRATRGGLIVTETSWCHAKGHVDGREPGLYAPEQVNAWRTVTRAARARGAVLLAQLGDPALQGAGLSSVDIDGILRRFRDAAEGAGDAGFDGVELLGAVPVWTADGGSPDADRIRLLVDVVLTLASVWPNDCVALRLAAPPEAVWRRHPEALVSLGVAVSAAFAAGVAYVHVGPAWPPRGHGDIESVAHVLPALRAVARPAGSALVVSGGIDGTVAETLLSAGDVDAVAFGRAFMTNPDLPWRLHCGAPLAPPAAGDDGGLGASGYLDHPMSDHVPANVRPEDAMPEALRCDAGP
ncbi:MAG: hypothetical protein ABW067_10170, partial [Rhizobacter sp.]